MGTPSIEISFLIPALNEEKNIEHCINAIRSNDSLLPTYEIVVGNHSSTDRTEAIAASLGAKVVTQKGGSIASLRNFLVAHSEGWLIVFLDADVRLSAQWGENIDKTISELRANPLKVTGSRCSPPTSDNFIIKNWFAVMPTKNQNYIGTGHIIFTRAACAEIGGFDSSLLTGEDYDFCIRAKAKGQSININQNLKVIHHDYPMSAKAFLLRERWHGLGDFQSIKNIKKSKTALLTLIFLILHLLLCVSIFLNGLLTTVFIFAIFLITCLASIVKFPRLSVGLRINNIFISYLYFWGRALSFVSRLRTLLK